MKIVFFGTPDYVLPILQSLHKQYKINKIASPIVAVVTQKPKPVGRKQVLQYSPVDNWAHKRKIPIYFDPKDLICDHIQADLGVLASFAKMIPQEVINHFSKGILNIHPSLLPKYRGASPVQAAIICGETITGVTIIKLDEELDHGLIVTQYKEDILENDTTESLRARLFANAAKVLIESIPAYMKGKINLKIQDESKVVYTKELTKEDGFIPPNYFATTLQGVSFQGEWKISFIKDCSLVPNVHNLECFIRAMQPWPVAWTFVSIKHKAKSEKKRLKILKAHLESPQATNYKLPTTRLIPDVVQLEGKNPVSWKQFNEAYHFKI